jgi:chemotaxis methyl-accepting protein methylase
MKFDQTSVTRALIELPSWGGKASALTSTPKRSLLAAMPGASTKPIEYIELDDVVLAWDEVTQEVIERPVRRLFCHKNKRTVAVSVVSDDGEKQEIEATTEHPFWVKGKGWVAASMLCSGDLLLRRNVGAPIFVESVSSVGEVADVFNFEVADVHNYFVGPAGILVHNSSGDDGLIHPKMSEWLADPKNQSKDRHYGHDGPPAGRFGAPVVALLPRVTAQGQGSDGSADLWIEHSSPVGEALVRNGSSTDGSMHPMIKSWLADPKNQPRAQDYGRDGPPAGRFGAPVDAGFAHDVAEEQGAGSSADPFIEQAAWRHLARGSATLRSPQSLATAATELFDELDAPAVSQYLGTKEGRRLANSLSANAIARVEQSSAPESSPHIEHDHLAPEGHLPGVTIDGPRTVHAHAAASVVPPRGQVALLAFGANIAATAVVKNAKSPAVAQEIALSLNPRLPGGGGGVVKVVAMPAGHSNTLTLPFEGGMEQQLSYDLADGPGFDPILGGRRAGGGLLISNGSGPKSDGRPPGREVSVRESMRVAKERFLEARRILTTSGVKSPAMAPQSVDYGESEPSVDSQRAGPISNRFNGITSAWRNEQAFRTIMRVAMIHKAQKGSVVGGVWKGERFEMLSAPCSIGLEPYALAMDLHMILGDGNYRVTGMDADSRALAIAERGMYPGAIPASGYGLDRLALHGLVGREGGADSFTLFSGPKAEVQYIPDYIKRNVKFVQADLAKPFPKSIGKFHAIMNENLAIYLPREARIAVMENFAAASREEALLVTDDRYSTLKVPGLRASVRYDNSFTYSSAFVHGGRP